MRILGPEEHYYSITYPNHWGILTCSDIFMEKCTARDAALSIMENTKAVGKVGSTVSLYEDNECIAVWYRITEDVWKEWDLTKPKRDSNE